MKNLRILWLIAIVGLLFSCQTQNITPAIGEVTYDVTQTDRTGDEDEEEGAYTIEGVVTNNSGMGLPNIAVRLDEPTTGYREGQMTNASGQYKFDNLFSGVYTLTINPGSPDEEVHVITL